MSDNNEPISRLIDRLPSELRGPVSGLIDDHLKGEPDESTRFRLYTAADALEPQPPIDWIVERLVAPGATELWAGEGGAKKTYSLLDMAVCVATGQPWLGMVTRQVPVLIIDEESGPRRLARRLGNTLRGHYADATTPIFYVSLALFNLRDKLDLAHLQDLIEQTEAKLIIIDALIDVIPGADENSAGDVHPVFQGLRSVADVTDGNIITIHHHNKAGGYRGSTAIKGAVDVVVNVKSKPSDDHIEFELEKSRDAEEFKWAATARWVDDTFDLSEADLEADRVVLGKAERYVLRFLEENGESDISTIKGNADSCTSMAARNAIYSLADKGLVERTDSGQKGTTAIYRLTEDAKSGL